MLQVNRGKLVPGENREQLVFRGKRVLLEQLGKLVHKV